MVNTSVGDSGVVGKVILSAFKRRQDRLRTRSPLAEIQTGFDGVSFEAVPEIVSSTVRAARAVVKPPGKRVRRFNENLAVMRALWADGNASFDGDFYKFKNLKN